MRLWRIFRDGRRSASLPVRVLRRPADILLQLSAMAYHRVLKRARTIADLADSEKIGPEHLAEALQYRPRMNVG